jgi:hypothetical protein
MITRLANKIFRSRDETGNSLLTFPKFMWVIRDFSLSLKDSTGTSITPDQYLENALSYQAGDGESVKAKNQIRRTFTDMFRER